MAKYNTLPEYLASIDDPENVQKLEDLINWALKEFPQLELRIAWNQPMLTDHGTFIMAFSAAKKHLGVSIEKEPLEIHRDEIHDAGYTSSKMMFQMPWDKEWNKKLLAKLIQSNIDEKKDTTTFWRS